MLFVTTNTRTTHRHLRATALRGHAFAALALRVAGDRIRAKATASRAPMVPASDGSNDLGIHVGSICAALAEELEVRLSVKTDEIRLHAACCQQVGLIVSELVRSAAHHNLKGRREAVEIILSGWGGNVRCLVKGSRSTGLGSQECPERRRVRMLAAELGGSVEWWFTESGSFAGLHFSIERSKELPSQLNADST
ncbi:hypothetical protein LB515_13505 [Mesorhizobium sp. CA15]|uniref:hypothetical protein n=1 Tax=Mesorhizobium sp. CA15 TaxID=2876641 RepID=UPI001CD13EFE|nr:hypothetical protein [Mesorhizobium sp. CA15]MBZ9866397.1 hypothetical protein [Mesorhizobium sp. CA15]